MGSADIGSFWRCSVVVPYVANYEESARAHLVPPSASARDVSYYFQGGANNRGTYGYAFRQAALAQLEHLPRAHISAFSLPGNPTGCREPRPGARARRGICLDGSGRKGSASAKTSLERALSGGWRSMTEGQRERDC